jgi:hypothetical protein
MPYRLSVPTREEGFPTNYPDLWRHYRIEVGQTLIQEAGTWSLISTPHDDELAAADNFYIGGYEHVVSDEIAAELIADGFESSLEEIL